MRWLSCVREVFSYVDLDFKPDDNCMSPLGQIVRGQAHINFIVTATGPPTRRGDTIFVPFVSHKFCYSSTTAQLITPFTQQTHCFRLAIFTLVLAQVGMHCQFPTCRYNTVRKEQLGPFWTYFHDIWYFSIFWKSVRKIQVPLKSDKNNGYYTWRLTYIFDHTAFISSENEKCSQQKLQRKSKHTLYVQ
jgi:hypothetical protein